MVNEINGAIASSFQALRQQGWSFRRIVRVRKIHRETVARYLRLAERDSEPANPLACRSPMAGDGPTAGSSGRHMDGWLRYGRRGR